VTTSVAPELFTIGFTEKPARKFFGLLLEHQVRTLIDTRLNNVSQLAGFAKGRDLAYFGEVIGKMSYIHRLDFAPTEELLKDYRGKDLTWDEYASRYMTLLEDRDIKSAITLAELNRACLVCSEHLPQRCHRSLLANYFCRIYPELHVTHLY
jgi:uncharacterized protein (DUF488 family)